MVSPCAFGRADFDGFMRRVWQGANAGAEHPATRHGSPRSGRTQQVFDLPEGGAEVVDD